jgi:ribonuclease HI
MNEWIHGWIKKGWKKSNKKPVENKELWIKLNELRNKQSSVEFIKVKGHDGVELNELADTLANKAMDELE